MAVVSWCLNLEKVRPIDTLWHVKEVVTARVWNIGQQGEIRKSSVSRLCHKRGVFCGPGRAHARPLRGFYVFWARMPCFFSFPTISSFLNCAKNAVGLVFSSLKQFAFFFNSTFFMPLRWLSSHFNTHCAVQRKPPIFPHQLKDVSNFLWTSRFHDFKSPIEDADGDGGPPHTANFSVVNVTHS